jgi:hypothetical protein
MRTFHTLTQFPRRSRRGATLAAVSALCCGSIRADNFADVRYDSQAQELEVTMAYRGTNPDHSFSLAWGKCEEPGPDGVHNIVAEVLDDQWDDKAEQEFKKTTRFSLADFSCRPAVLTLRTAPRYYLVLRIP